MAIEPVVQLINIDTLEEYDTAGTVLINFGTVKAGDASATINLRLWNNKGGTEDASTMKDTEMFILDGNDAKLEPIVVQGWLHAKCVSGGDTTFTRLYDNNTLPITAAGMVSGQIAGTINSGLDTDTTNFADISIYMQIIENVLEATHGEKPFSLAFRYYFT